MNRKNLIASLLVAALSVSLIPTASVVSAAADISGVAGDVSGDGTLSADDAFLMQKWLLSYTSEQDFKSAIISTAEVKIGGSYKLTVNGNTVAEFNVTSPLTKQGDVGSFGFGGW